MKVYIVVPFEEYQGHYAQDAKVFSSLLSAEAYAARREAEQEAEGEVYLDWDVYEQELDSVE
jgi:hypothetical protein